MKKLFVAVLTIAALAACQKDNVDNGIALDSKSKTVQITLLNGTTRADGGDTAAGVTGQTYVADNELMVLFAKNDGTVLFKDFLTSADQSDDDHTGIDQDTLKPEFVKDESADVHMWHNVPWDVTQIAVVRLDATLDADIYALDHLGTLAEYENQGTGRAYDEVANLNRPMDKIALYGIAPLQDTGATHRVGNVVYHVYNANIEVASAFARFEVRNIECYDLGVNNEGDDDFAAPYSYDELELEGLTWNGQYTAYGIDADGVDTVGERVYGCYVPTSAKCDPNTYTGTENRANYEAADYKPTNGAWSWNVRPTTFTNLTLKLNAYAYNYVINDEDRALTLTVTGLSTTEGGEATPESNKFEANNVYHINLKFSEENFKDEAGLCVTVNVEVAPWSVVERFPVYQK